MGPLTHGMAAPLSPTTLTDLPPRYRVVSLLGEGGMGRVFRVHDAERREDVALKVVRTATAGDRLRLEREIRALLKLRHEDVVRIHDVGISGDDAFFTMELLEGSTLDRLLPAEPPDPQGIARALALGERILGALERVHEGGLIHGDIKPSNIFVLGDGETKAVKLLDFGLALESEAARLRAGAGEGSPLYTAPERFLGNPAGERSDLYSAGAVLYHLITGRAPFRSLAAALGPRALPVAPAEINPHVGEETSSFLLSLLQFEPGRRPAGAAEAIAALRTVSGSAGRRESIRLLPPEFSGREEEAARLRSFLRGESATRCLHITGEAGSGKTWLLERSGVLGEAVVGLRLRLARGVFTKDGALHEGLRTVFGELLRIIESAKGGRALEAVVSQEGHFLDALGIERDMPAESPAAAPAEPQAHSGPSEERLAAAAAGIVRAALHAAPFLVSIEGLHNADESDVAIIARMERALRGSSGRLLVTYRSSGRASRAVALWAEALETEGRLDTLSMGPLSDRGLADLARSMLRPAAPAGPGLLCVLAREEGGMPLGAARRIEDLWARGALELGPGGWELRDDFVSREARDDDIPALAPGDAASGKVSSLSREEVLALGAADVLSAPFDEDLLARVMGADVRESGGITRKALRSLVRAGLLDEGPDGYRLSAGIDAGPAVSGLDEETIARLHENAGRALLSRHGPASGGHLFRAAGHMERAARRNQALELYLAAARHASRSFANRRAVEAYERALELAPDGPERAELLEEMGDLHARLGDHGRALELFQSALGRRPKNLSVLGKVGRVHQRCGDLGRARECFERCLEGAGDDLSARALTSFRLAQVHLDAGDTLSARSRFEESSRLHARLGDSRQLAAIHSGLGILEKREGRVREAISHFEKALRAAESSGSPGERATILNNLGNLHRALGNDAAAIDCLKRSLEERERAGDRQGLAICLNNLGRVHFHRGDLAASRKATEASLGLFEELGDRKGVLIAGCNLGEAAGALGDFARASEILKSTKRLAEASRLPRFVEASLVNIASLEADAGDHDSAAGTVRSALRTMPGDGALELRSMALAILGGALLRLGDFEGAEDAIRESLESVRELELDAKLPYPAAARVRWLVERGEPENAVREAEDILKRLAGAERLGEARFRLELGRAYRELGPDWADRTEKHLLGALAAFEEMGSPHHAAEARGELALYWSLVGEDGEARAQRAAQEAALRKLGLSRRLDALAQGRGA